MLPPSIDILVPFWGLAGGVIKILDYADHASTLGISTTLWAPTLPAGDDLVHTLPVLQRLLERDNVSIERLEDLALDPETTVLFTEPVHHRLVESAVPTSLGPRLIHLIQGTRHANPSWNDGLNYRLLHRPMTRIVVSKPVADAIEPVVDTTHATSTIVEGHDCAFFSTGPIKQQPTSGPLRVLYSTWKSDLGDRVAEASAALDSPPVFIAMREPLGWTSLRNRYRGADIFLCSPGPEEGFYLPGLEAMAAGLAVVTALVGGNEAYVRPGENALDADYEDVETHVAALERLCADADLRRRLVGNGSATTAAHTLEREREAFGDVLASIGP